MREMQIKITVRYYFIPTESLLSKKADNRISLVVQWLRIRLPLQGIWVWNLVQEDSTCHRATMPMHHSYWASALKPASCSCWSLCSAIRWSTTMRSLHTATETQGGSSNNSKKNLIITSIGEDVEKLEPSYNANENIKWYIHFGKQVVLLIVKRTVTI